MNNKNFSQCSIFNITQQEFEQLAELSLKYPMVYATSLFDVGKINSPLPLKPDAVSKKQRANKILFHSQDKLNRILDIIEQYENISTSK